MPAISVDESKLRELVEQAVERYLKLTFEDMEEIRRSPEAAIIRLESRVESMQNTIDKQLMTKTEFHEFGRDILGQISSLSKQISSVKATQKLLVALYFSMFAMWGALLVKILFFIP